MDFPGETIQRGEMDLKIKYAGGKDLPFIDYLQKKNAEELSFYPISAFEKEVENERVLLALVNNQHAGYLYHGAIGLDRPLKIHQACIEYDLRGNWYGAALCSRLEEIGAIGGVKTISLRCGSDIAANVFWENMGFICVAVIKGGVVRKRDINVWQKLLGIDLFGFDAVDPSAKQKSRKEYQKAWSQKKRALDDGQPLAKGKLDRRQGQGGVGPTKHKAKKKARLCRWPGNPGKKEIKP